MDKPVYGSLTNGFVIDPASPFDFHQLRTYDCGRAACAIIQELEKIVLSLREYIGHHEVIDDQYFRLGKAASDSP